MNKLEELHKIFSNVNDWLKFAEAKNAVLIGFISTVLGLLIAGFDNFSECSQTIIKCILMPVEIIAIIFSVLSFFPYFELNNISSFFKIGGKINNNKKNNIYFFEHLKDLKSIDVINYFELKENDNFTIDDKISKDLTEQIITNSNITSQKLKLFKFSGFVALVGFLISAILYVILKFVN